MKEISIHYKVLAVAFLLLAFIVFLSWSNVQPVLGSVSFTDEYQATSTAPSASAGAFVLVNTKTLKAGQFSACALGSVIITGANTGGLDFYNATTSNVSLRTGQKATSTILLASIPPSAVANTYTFDVACTDGLLMSLSAGVGTIPTTTVTYR